VSLDPQPGLHDLEFERYRAGTRGLPYCVRDQFGHEQDGGLFRVGQPPGGQHFAGNLPCQPYRLAAGWQRQLQVPPGCSGPTVTRVTVCGLVAHRLKASTSLSAGYPGAAHGDAIAGFPAPRSGRRIADSADDGWFMVRVYPCRVRDEHRGRS
jgi:hypothetical protein